MKKMWVLVALLASGGLGFSSVVSTAPEDSCVAQCDSAAEKCSVQAGRDQSKAHACDDAYDACLSKCKPG
jgi:hypothetical protein